MESLFLPCCSSLSNFELDLYAARELFCIDTLPQALSIYTHEECGKKSKGKKTKEDKIERGVYEKRRSIIDSGNVPRRPCSGAFEW